MRWVPILSLLAATAGAAPVETHATAARVAHLEKALAALRSTPEAQRARADAYVRALERGQCAAASERLTVDCLITAARRYCQKGAAGCPALLDVVISNVLADRQLISDQRRYELMKGAADPRAAVAAELRRIQGALAVDFRLRMGDVEDDPAVARAIDRYCLTAADGANLPWQACASLLVWFLRVEGER